MNNSRNEQNAGGAENRAEAAGQSVEQNAEQRARLVCMACPVQTECARYALALLAVTEVEGIWAGMSPFE